MTPVLATLSPETSSLLSIPSSLTTYEQMETDVRAKLGGYELTGARDSTVSILENFVRCLPRDGARNICKDIIGCNCDEELRHLADHLLTAVLVPMKSHGGTPLASPSPRFGAEHSVEEISSELFESCTRNDQAWLKAACLRRDNNRCVLTQFYDANEADKNLSGSEYLEVTTEITEAAHIIPFSLGNFAETEVKPSHVYYIIVNC
ncbi:hypothetical protein Q9L58_000530 [Maublancomyces gigas]|uniref:HNH nuclease domain-containing protein n=1 Tax=Discina gigas TaxID=1032678 RepID=A0ABR3GWH9_9PEZI